MSDEDPKAALLMGALGTEHFVLQSVAGATISESGNRASMYLASLSSGLVAIGFASAAHRTLAIMSFTILPTVFVLGWLTIARLLDTSVENAVSRRRIELIRGYYASIGPEAEIFFGPESPSSGLLGVRYGRTSVLFTTASMVVIVNSVVGGATLSLLARLGFSTSVGVAVGCGCALGILTIVLGIWYEIIRMKPYVADRGTRPESHHI
jgi:hypothetical protein